MKNNLPLYLIAVGICIIILQNAGIIHPLNESTITVSKIKQSVTVSGDVSVLGDVNANLSSVAGYDLVSSKKGMYIGVKSVDNTIIPIHWGEISIAP
jgi:hypothetical protein